MKKENPKIRWHLTSAEKQQIRRLTKKGMRQCDISKTLRIGRDTVAKWQHRMALPTIVPIDESEVERLFKEGWGGVRIARHLCVSVSRIYKVFHRRGLRRADGVGTGYPNADVEGFIAAVRAHSDYSKNLAHTFSIGICRAQRLARETLGVQRIRPGRAWPPLTSNFPEQPKTISYLAEVVINRIFEGAPPRYPEIIAKAVAEAIPELREIRGDQALAVFQSQLASELRKRIGDDSMRPNSWVH